MLLDRAKLGCITSFPLNCDGRGVLHHRWCFAEPLLLTVGSRRAADMTLAPGTPGEPVQSGTALNLLPAFAIREICLAVARHSIRRGMCYAEATIGVIFCGSGIPRGFAVEACVRAAVFCVGFIHAAGLPSRVGSCCSGPLRWRSGAFPLGNCSVWLR